MHVIELDLTTPRADVRRDVSARQVLVMTNPGDLELRAGSAGADLIPAIPGLSLEAGPAGAILELYFTNTAGAGSAFIFIVD